MDENICRCGHVKGAHSSPIWKGVCAAILRISHDGTARSCPCKKFRRKDKRKWVLGEGYAVKQFEESRWIGLSKSKLLFDLAFLARTMGVRGVKVRLVLEEV